MKSEDFVETLINLGLTRNEARVYIVLVGAVARSAREIAERTKITRQDIYRILPKLQERGLIGKSIANPTKYRAMPAKPAISGLLKLKNNEYKELQQNVKKMIFYLKDINEPAQQNYSGFVLIPAKGSLVQKVRVSISQAKKSLRLVVPENRFWQGLNEFQETRDKALRNGVAVRIITNRPLESNTLSEVETIRRKERLEIKFIPEPPEAVVVLVDEKEVFLIISPSADIRESPALWSDNPSLIHIAKNYFENLWTKQNND